MEHKVPRNNLAEYIIQHRQEILDAYQEKGTMPAAYELLCQKIDKFSSVLSLSSFRNKADVLLLCIEEFSKTDAAPVHEQEAEVTIAAEEVKAANEEINRLREELRVAEETTSKLTDEIQSERSLRKEMSINQEELRSALEQAEEKIGKYDEDARVAVTTIASLETELRDAKEVIAKLEKKVVKETIVTINPDAEEHERVTWDQEEAVIEALKRCRGNVRNAIIPMSQVLEAYNQLLPKEMRLDKPQRLTALIKSMTKKKSISRQGKFERKNERCLVWNKQIIELIGGRGNDSSDESV